MTDIAIIGGGIAGISAAARLSHHASVTLFEGEDRLGYHASGRSAAAFVEDYGNSVVRSLNSASATYLRDENGGVLSPRGMLLVAKAGDRDQFEHEHREFGLDTISVIEARHKIPILNPEMVQYAGFREDIYDIDTDLLLQNFRREALKNGAEIHIKSQVTALSYGDQRWTITTPNGVYRATILVNAAGAWADPLAQMAGLDVIPSVVRRVADEIALAVGLIENIQRENLNPVEEANGLRRLLDEFGLTHQQVADSIGRSRAAVSNLLRLLNLDPAVRAHLENGRLEAGHARAILSLPREQQLAAADTVIQQRLSVRQTEQLVRRYLSGKRKKKRKPAPRDADLHQLEEELSQLLAATVSLEQRGQGGRVIIEYNSLDELEGILERLRK